MPKWVNHCYYLVLKIYDSKAVKVLNSKGVYSFSICGKIQQIRYITTFLLDAVF